jgi:hypothetical protein
MRLLTQAAPRRLAVLLLLGLATPAVGRAGDGFGSSAPFELQPEVDVFKHLSQDQRLILQVPTTYSPSDGYSDVQANLFYSLLFAPLQSIYLSPDIAKTRTVELRAGAGYFTTTTAGDPTPLQRLILFGEFTPRGRLPLDVAFQWRNRYEARWEISANDKFSQRFRTRLQLERDFVIPGHPGDALTPYANAEFIWSSSIDKWQQTRLLAGLVWSVQWFAKGESLEVNGGAFITLQPSRSTAPVLGLVYSQYFD